jgi:hypothetical protein
MAAKKNIGDRYNMNIIAPNCSNTCNDNTKNIVRIINSVFHQYNYNTFLCLNDRKSRDDFETGVGAKNNKFWALLADYVNDASNIELDSFYYIDDEVYKKHIEDAELMGFKPIGCSQQSGPSCRLVIEGLVKIRGTIIGNMSRSGEHGNDPYMFAEVAIKRHNLVKTVSKFAAYFFFYELFNLS